MIENPLLLSGFFISCRVLNIAMKFRILDTKLTLENILITDERNDIPTRSVRQLPVALDGFPGDRHYGARRKSGARETNLFPRGTEIPNLRQWSAVSVEEMGIIAESMGIEELKGEWIGANLVFSGLKNFTNLPPFTRLRAEGNSPCTLIVYEENKPCKFPQPFIDESASGPSKVGFASAAQGLRGLVGWVERGGLITQGESFEVWIPSFAEWKNDHE